MLGNDPVIMGETLSVRIAVPTSTKPLIIDIDRYARMVAEVRFLDGRSLNHELVKAGACWWYRKYAPHDTELKQLEKEARKQRRGVWATASPVSPWEWRKQNRVMGPVPSK